MGSFIGRREGIKGTEEEKKRGRERKGGRERQEKTCLPVQRNSGEQITGSGRNLSLKGTFCTCVQNQGTACPGPQRAGPRYAWMLTASTFPSDLSIVPPPEGGPYLG